MISSLCRRRSETCLSRKLDRDAYAEASSITAGTKGPLFRRLGRRKRLISRRLHRLEVLTTIKRQTKKAGFSETTCCHSLRATGITTYLENGGTIENAQQIAVHESLRTTKLLDHTSDVINPDQIERITIQEGSRHVGVGWGILRRQG